MRCDHAAPGDALGSPPLRCYKPAVTMQGNMPMFGKGRVRLRRSALGAASLALSLLAAENVAAQSLTDRFKSLFGGGQPETPAATTPSQAAPSSASEPTCPPVSIRPGASTYAVGLPGKPASGVDLRFQVSISRTARECVLTGGQITARIGVQGRVVVGPAGGPPTVDIPLRVAVVQEGVQPKTIFTRAYVTSTPLNDTSEPFSYVMEDVTYPVPAGAAGDAYVFYIGFDPQALKSAPKPARRR